jgi:hypothetical protein
VDFRRLVMPLMVHTNHIHQIRLKKPLITSVDLPFEHSCRCFVELDVGWPGRFHDEPVNFYPHLAYPLPAPVPAPCAYAPPRHAAAYLLPAPPRPRAERARARAALPAPAPPRAMGRPIRCQQAPAACALGLPAGHASHEGLS